MRRLLAGIALMAGLLPAIGAPKAELWERWTGHGKAAAIAHAEWDAFLKEHVSAGADGIHRLDYRTAGHDSRRLDDYIARLQGVRVTALPRDEQRAYWINLYNAATVRVVVEHYPVPSITRINISPGLFSKGPWGKKLLNVEGQPVSLDDIEHRILRPIWQDPRIHYACNCASLGCPNLALRAFTAANTDKLLDEGARAFVNHPRGARVASEELVVSSIYHWYKADFGGDDVGVIGHLRKYAAPALKQQLRGVTRIADHQYDWSLNDVAR